MKEKKKKYKYNKWGEKEKESVVGIAQNSLFMNIYIYIFFSLPTNGVEKKKKKAQPYGHAP